MAPGIFEQDLLWKPLSSVHSLTYAWMSSHLRIAITPLPRVIYQAIKEGSKRFPLISLCFEIKRQVTQVQIFFPFLGETTRKDLPQVFELYCFCDTWYFHVLSRVRFDQAIMAQPWHIPGFFPHYFYFLLCSLRKFTIYFNKPLYQLEKLDIF